VPENTGKASFSHGGHGDKEERKFRVLRVIPSYRICKEIGVMKIPEKAGTLDVLFSDFVSE
jgi:hypothetical protein